MKKYDQYTAADKIDAHLHDNDIHYLTGDISNDNITETIKWILSANLNKKPKRTLKLYINSYGGDLYESFALIDVMKRCMTAKLTDRPKTIEVVHMLEEKVKQIGNS